MKKHNGFSVSTVIVLLILYGTLVGGTGDLYGVENEAQGVDVSGYDYNPMGKPDPFRPFIESETAVKKKKAETKRPRVTSLSPLQKSSIDQYKLKGIAGNGQNRSAIVADANGKFYPVFRGTTIGLNNGKVVAILADRVVVEETAKNQKGEPKVTRVTMKLHDEYLEGKP